MTPTPFAHLPALRALSVKAFAVAFAFAVAVAVALALALAFLVVILGEDLLPRTTEAAQA